MYLVFSATDFRKTGLISEDCDLVMFYSELESLFSTSFKAKNLLLTNLCQHNHQPHPHTVLPLPHSHSFVSLQYLSIYKKNALTQFYKQEDFCPPNVCDFV